MKKYFISICLLAIFLIGCGSEEKKEQKVEKKDLTISVYEQLEVSKDPLEKKDNANVEKGVKTWAEAFLAVNSDAKEKKIKDKALYKSVTNEKQRRKLKKERTNLYKNHKVVIEDVKVEVEKSNKAVLKGRNVGVVECTVKVSGEKDKQNYKQTYDMKIVVDYIGDVVSVYEINDITW